MLKVLRYFYSVVFCQMSHHCSNIMLLVATLRNNNNVWLDVVCTETSLAQIRTDPNNCPWLRPRAFWEIQDLLGKSPIIAWQIPDDPCEAGDIWVESPYLVAALGHTIPFPRIPGYFHSQVAGRGRVHRPVLICINFAGYLLQGSLLCLLQLQPLPPT